MKRVKNVSTVELTETLSPKNRTLKKATPVKRKRVCSSLHMHCFIPKVSLFAWYPKTPVYKQCHSIFIRDKSFELH